MPDTKVAMSHGYAKHVYQTVSMIMTIPDKYKLCYMYNTEYMN